MPMLRNRRTLRYFGVSEDNIDTAERGARPAFTYRGARRNAARDAQWPLRRHKRKEPKFD